MKPGPEVGSTLKPKISAVNKAAERYQAAPAEAPKTNAGRSLEDIAADIHALDREKAFAIGALLVEARESAKPGKWMEWLSDEFDWSEDTARNYMAAYRLGERFRTVRNLPLPKRTIYQLGNDFLENPGLQ